MPVRNNFLQLLRGTGPKASPTEEEIRIWAAEDGSLWTILSDGTAAPVAGPGALPNPTDDGDVLTVVEGEWAGAPGGGSQPVSSPLDITGCILWLDASTLALADDEPVALWSDGSPSGFDATQTDPASRPVCKTAAQNGFRVVRFDSQGTIVPQWLSLTGEGLGLLNGLDAASAIFCASVRDEAGGQLLAVLTNGGNARRFFIGFDTSGGGISDVTVRASNNDSLDAELISSLGSGVAPVIKTTAAAASASVNTNEASVQASAVVWDESSGSGDSQLAAAGAFPNTDADQVQIGGDNTAPGNSLYDGDIFEIAIYDRILTARERRELIEYLSDKWATL